MAENQSAAKEQARFPAVINESAVGLRPREAFMDSVIYLVGLVVVVLAILSFLGLR
jgi:hypothetical protein